MPRHDNRSGEAESLILHVLKADDVALSRAMLGLFGSAFEGETTFTHEQPDDAYLQRLLEGDTFVAMVAEADSHVIGALVGYVLPKFEQARSEFYIYDLAVDSRYRRRGVAMAMIGRLETLAASRGIHVIYVQAEYGDDPAIALNSKLGTREDVLHFEIAPAGSAH
jgi:aminoglycoside 3-N-acetyltransferase I